MLTKILGLLFFLYLGKFLRTEQFAQFSLFVMCSEFCSGIVTFGIQSGMLRMLNAERTPDLFAGAIWTVLLNWCVLAAVTSVALPLALPFLGENYQFLVHYPAFLLVRVLAIAILAIVSAFYVTTENPRLFVRVQAASALLNLILLLFLHFGGAANVKPVEAVFASYSISGILAAGLALLLSRNAFEKTKPTISLLGQIYKNSWVFMVKNLVGAFQVHSARLLLSVMVAPSLLGIFSFYQTLFVQFSFFVNIFSQAFIPHVRNLVFSNDSEKVAKGDGVVKKGLLAYSALSIIVLAIVGVAAKAITFDVDWLRVIVNPSYFEDIYLFFLVSISFLLGNFRTFTDVWQFSPNRKSAYYLMGVTALVFAMSYFGNYILIAKFSVYGAAMNQICVYIVHFIISLFLYHRFVTAPGR